MLEILSESEVLREYPLTKLIRYNHRNRLQNETVAEHTCFVSLFCLKIMSKLNLSHETERQILILAALHDTCESITSDIPHDVKANYPKMREILEEIEEDYYKENWESYYKDIYEASPIAQYVLKLADAYSVYQWCINEKTLGNNDSRIEEIYKDAKNRLTTITNQINEELK